VTEFGISPNGEIVSVTTKPSSEPTMLKFQSSESSLKISWSEPVYQANGIKIEDYRVVLKDSVGQVVADQQVQDVTNIKFDNLNAVTKYIVTVKAIAEFIRKDSATNTTKKIQEYSHPATLIAFTAANPLNPNSFQANADYYSVTLDLGKSNITQVPRVTGYVVRYSLMDSTGRNIKPGTSRTQSFPGNNDPKKIIGLASGFTYGLEVQEITTVGKSIFSSPIFIVRTDPRVETNIQECSWTSVITVVGNGPVKVKQSLWYL
uniref:Fibronectin type-III domain-containing protein n=1 Tax=Clytia hemisphaerica TaxID=252671 RepID=A0A7M5VFW0_9CNID